MDLVLGLINGATHHLHDNINHHGNQGQPHQHIDGGRQEVLGMFWEHVSEANGRDGDEDKVKSLQVGPLLPLAVDGSTEQDVDDGDEDGDNRG